MTLPGRIAKVGRVAAVRWNGVDSSFNPASISDLWNLTPANTTLGSTPTATGTTPPVVTFSGTLTTPYGVRIEIQTTGALGASTFRISLNNGSNYVASGVNTVASYGVPGTALTVNFPSATYTNDNVYRATAGTGRDSSPAVQDASQATPSQQPFFTLANASFNGNPTWDSPNATGTCLETGLFTAIGGTTTHVIVCQSTSSNTAVNQGIFTRSAAGTNLRAFVFNTVGGANVRLQSVTGANNSFYGGVLGPSILIVEFTTTDVSVWLNGNALGKLPASILATNSFRLFNNAAAPGTTPLIGSIADVRYIGKALSRAERRNVFSYFSTKHAIPVALAS